MTHTVKAGETLAKIARAHRITLQQLLDANPQFRANPDIIHVGDVLIIPDGNGAPVTPPVITSAPSPFARRLAAIAQDLHGRFHTINEADPELCGSIKRWTEDIGGAFVSCTSNDHPWSAVFVSWCVKEAGATSSEFKFSKRHAVFVNKAIKDAEHQRGVFHGLRIGEHPPNVGDIIQHNRSGTSFTFEHARTHTNYPSHSKIVVEIGQDATGRFAFCIGGNEGDSIRTTTVRLTPDGFVQQRGRNPFICVIKTLK